MPEWTARTRYATVAPMANPPRGPVNTRTPPGDTRPRQVCDSCGFVHYINPRMVVGALSVWREKILLCRRAIEPRVGFWTLPAGYLELNEGLIPLNPV